MKLLDMPQFRPHEGGNTKRSMYHLRQRDILKNFDMQVLIAEFASMFSTQTLASHPVSPASDIDSRNVMIYTSGGVLKSLENLQRLEREVGFEC